MHRCIRLGAPSPRPSVLRYRRKQSDVRNVLMALALSRIEDCQPSHGVFASVKAALHPDLELQKLAPSEARIARRCNIGGAPFLAGNTCVALTETAGLDGLVAHRFDCWDCPEAACNPTVSSVTDANVARHPNRAERPGAPARKNAAHRFFIEAADRNTATSATAAPPFIGLPPPHARSHDFRAVTDPRISSSF